MTTPGGGKAVPTQIRSKSMTHQMILIEVELH
jgi:hypothetical protein